MNYCNNSFCLWLSKHIVTTILIISVMCFTFVNTFFKQYTEIFFNYFSFFNCSDFSCLSWFILLQLLMSGLEVSVGSFKYFIWLFFNAFLICIFRLFLNINTKDCYFFIYSQFIPFLMIHKPYYYMKIKKLSFTDSLFYFISMVQTMFLCQNLLDIPIVLIGNIVFKFLLKLFKCCDRPPRITQILRDNNGIGEELEINLPSDETE